MRLAVHLGELRLVVEGLEVRRSAGLIEEDDALGLGGMMQRIDDAGAMPREQARIEQRVQAQQAEAGDAAAEEGAAVRCRDDCRSGSSLSSS